MTQATEEIAALRSAMLRAQAMGFDRTAEAIRQVLDKLISTQTHAPRRQRSTESVSGDSR